MILNKIATNDDIKNQKLQIKELEQDLTIGPAFKD